MCISVPLMLITGEGGLRFLRSQNDANISRKNSSVSKLLIHAKAHNITTNLLLWVF